MEAGPSQSPPRSSAPPPPKPEELRSHRSETQSHVNYREKYFAMKNRYDQSSNRRGGFRRDLEKARHKMKQLQAENDLLLDALQLAQTTTPELFDFSVYPYEAPRLSPPPMPSITADDLAREFGRGDLLENALALSRGVPSWSSRSHRGTPQSTRIETVTPQSTPVQHEAADASTHPHPTSVPGANDRQEIPSDTVAAAIEDSASVAPRPSSNGMGVNGWSEHRRTRSGGTRAVPEDTRIDG